MGPSTRRSGARLALTMALLLVAALGVNRLLRGPVPAEPPADGEAPPSPRPAEPPSVPASERGYVRRLKVIEPPNPGEPPRAVRDAAVVEAETAVEPAPQAGGAAQPRLARSLLTGNAPDSSLSLVSGPENPGPSRPGPGDGGRAKPGRGADGKRPPASSGADMAALSSASSEASRLVARARGRLANAAASGANPLSPEAVATALREQIALDRKSETMVRDALSGLGSGASPEDQQAAVAKALGASGRPADPESVTEALAEASQPPRPAPSPAAVADAIAQVSTNLPDAKRLDELSRLAMKPPPRPNAPPPKGGVSAYVTYRDAFDRVEKDFGLRPDQVVPFPAIETSLGANTGKFPLRDTLLAINTDVGGRFKPAQRAQAGRDLAAMTRLLASGDLGGRRVEQLYGSNMGAIGITQFLPSSWAAYGLSFSGGPRDPWNFRDAVLSTGNYLEKHGSRKDYDRAILSYNYSEKYRQDIKQYGANVAPGIRAVQEQAAGK